MRQIMTVILPGRAAPARDRPRRSEDVKASGIDWARPATDDDVDSTRAAMPHLRRGSARILPSWMRRSLMAR
ncbi:hypothetical protein GCM10018953_71940 [Streptosporangium nondiastaticum]